MMKYARKNQLKQAEMQGNKEQIVQGETGSQKMTRQSKKQIENQSQSGRSMVEMLGVLAIIAILSIGGIIMFRYAMNYYQANQIAHEMNMMRTDAQIKIAQGTEELMLGEPYDPVSDSQLGHIQFNDAYLVDFDCVYMEDENAEPSPAFCTAANAYYIELKNIPEGVCRPLANLIDNMDNEIAFYINDKSVDAEEEKGACSEGDNTLTVVFGADSDSNAVKCDTDTECELLESTPVCDKPRHVCVECTEEKGCEGEEYCENNVCKTCESGVWNGEKNRCVECTTDDDCLVKGTENPVCNKDTNTCAPCPDGQQWKESAKGCASYECRTNKDCSEGKYCYFKANGMQTGCTGEWNDETQGGTCKDVDGAFQSITATIKNQDYVVSNESMTWWSACRLCAANADRDDSDCAYPTTATPDFMLDASILECNPAVKINSKQHGCCYLNGTDISIGSNVSKEDLSDSINELRKTKGCNPNIKGYQGGALMCPYHFWASNSFSNEFVYGIDMDSGYIAHNARNDGDYAFDFGGYAVCHQ